MELKNFHIITFGCQMNENDSLQLSALLEKELNLTYSYDIEKTDLIIINTCSVREKPEKKVFSIAGRFAKQNTKKNRIIGIMGCVAQEYGDEILKKAKYIDFVAGTHNIHNIPKIIKKIVLQRKKISKTDFYDTIPSLSVFTKPYGNSKVQAYVSVMQGCNNFCSYCIVPYVRGREYSRPYKEIIEEIKFLVSQGVTEVTLLGQNVNSYGTNLNNNINFPELLNKIAKTEGLKRIRFTTSHPKDFNEELINVMKEHDNICKQLHLPIQSGSNKILKLMNRKYTKEEYLEKVYLLKRIIPEIMITTDIIVGFPFEDQQDFKETLDILKEVKFISSFSFVYSPRPFTKYADLDNVEINVKKERLSQLQKLQKEITFNYNQDAIGKVFNVLVEGKSKKSSTELSGRTEDNRIVNFKGDESLIGKFVDVEITKGFQNSLKGKIHV